MDGVLSNCTFKFNQSSLSGRKAWRVSLGNRNQSDGTTVAVWAYISDDRTRDKPPIIFRDELRLDIDGLVTTRLYPRAASSLLRKAGQLRTPFCFLQQEVDQGVKDSRGMICAVVAYYALIEAALDYINTVYALPKAKHEIQHKTTSKLTGPTVLMVSSEAAPKKKALTTTASADMILEVEDGACQPTNFADGDYRHNSSLVIRLKLDQKALAETTGVAPLSEVLECQDKGSRFSANECDSGLDDDIDSVIGDDFDSVIGDDIEDISRQLTHST